MRLRRFWGASLNDVKWRANTDLSGEASLGDDIGWPKVANKHGEDVICGREEALLRWTRKR